MRRLLPVIGGAMLAIACGTFPPEAEAGYRNFRRNPNGRQGAPAASVAAAPDFQALAPGSTDQSATADACDTYSASMTGAPWCLRGDGTGTGATLTATGSPATQTHSMCGNGLSCGSVSSKRFSNTAYYQTAATASPAGSFTVCETFQVDDASGAFWLASKMVTASTFRWLLSGGRLTADVYKAGGSISSVTTAVASVTSRAPHHACARYTYVADGTSLLKQFVDGVASGTALTNGVGPPAAASSVWSVGRNAATGTAGFVGTIGNAFFTETALDDATILAMSNTALGKLTPSIGSAIAVARTSAKVVLDTTGAETTVIPAARPGVTQSALDVEPAAATNLVLQSSVFSNASWTKSNMTCVNTATHPDGTALASRCTATGANGSACQALTVASSQRATSIQIKRAVGTGTTNLSRDNLSTRVDVTASVGASYFRVTPETHAGLSTTSANPTICLELATSGDAVDVAYAQDEAGAFATSPIETTTASVTRAAEVPTFTNPLNAANPSQGCMAATLVPHGGWGGGSLSRGVLYIGTAASANSAQIVVNSSRVPVFTVYDNASGTKLVTGSALTADSASHRFVAQWNSGTLALYVDGVAVGSVSGAGTGILTQPASITIGGGGAGGRFSNIKVGATTTACGVSDALAAAPSSTDVLALGDSTTLGDTLNPTYPQKLATLTGRSVLNAGVGGNAVAACKSRYEASYQHRLTHGTVAVLCGINDIRLGSSAASTWTTLQSLFTTIRTNGQRLIPITVTPFKNFATWNSTQQAELVSLNASITSYASANGLTLVNAYGGLGGEGGDAAVLLATYDSGDHLHPNQAGAEQLAALVAPAAP